MGLHEQNENRILEAALAACERVTGLLCRVIQLEPRITTACRADALIEIRNGPRQYRFAVDVKNVDRVAALGHVQARLMACPEPGLVVVKYMTEELADNCRRLELNFIDTAGNAYLKADGLTVFVVGRKPRTAEPRPTFRAFNATGLRVIFALLCRRELLQAPYREVQREAGVALGTVGWVLNDLHNRGYLVHQENGNRFMDAERLATQWVEHYPLKLRPKLNAKRFLATDPTWWHRFDPLEYAAYWGGEVGADRLTGDLRPEHITIYAREDPKEMILRNRLRADIHGNIEILDTFWDFPPTGEHPDVVPPLLVYADLMATVDQRNHEVARRVYKRHVGPALD